MIEKYLVGKGIDVSENSYIPGAEHKYLEPSGLYLLRDDVGIEVFDYLYGKYIINNTKYFRILLYEWFLVVKKNGFIIIEFEDNEILDYNELKKELSSLLIYRDKFQIIEENTDFKENVIVIQKNTSIKVRDDEINEWTFGIITNGKRNEFVEKSIDSIRELNVPKYEIIVCGTYEGKLSDDIRYIHFTEKDDKGWITKKKNIVCENSRYENIVVIHDRIYFNKNWYEGVKKYGNYFEVLSCPVWLPIGDSNVKTLNWATPGYKFNLDKLNKMQSMVAGVEESDWDPHVFVGGTIIMLKKHIWAVAKWNEGLFWGDFEDIEYSHRQHEKGIMIRFNPYCEVSSLTVPGVILQNYYEKNSRKLGKLHVNFLINFTLATLDFLKIKPNSNVVVWGKKNIKKLFGATNWKDLK